MQAIAIRQPVPLTPQQAQDLGKSYRPNRLTIIVNHLMMCAQKGLRTKYADINMICKVRSHHEVRILLIHVFDLCMDNGWPIYNSLVRNQDPNTKEPSDVTGNGYFEYAEKVMKIKIEDRDHFLKAETKRCFNTPLPPYRDVSIAIENHILKHNL